MQLACCRLKEKGRIFREAFLAKLALLLRGTVQAPPERFGETLADEHIRGGEPPPLVPCAIDLPLSVPKILCCCAPVRADEESGQALWAAEQTVQIADVILQLQLYTFIGVCNRPTT